MARRAHGDLVVAPRHPPRPGTAPYSFEGILARVELIQRQSRGWARFFAENGITPLVVIYEELVSDYDATVRRALGHVGVGPSAREVPPPVTRVVCDERSERLLIRFQQDLLTCIPPQKLLVRHSAHEPRPGWTLPIPALDQTRIEVIASVTEGRLPAPSPDGDLRSSLSPRSRVVSAGGGRRVNPRAFHEPASISQLPSL